MSLLQNSNAISAGGYDINNSLRFRASASAYLNRTFATPTNNKIWTYSTWIKRGSLTTTQVLLATASEELRYIADGGASGVVDSFQYNAGAGYGFRTNATYRDVSAWYHIVVAVDTTQATAANRARIYINGVEASTDGTYNISQNTNTQINSAVSHNIARRTSGSLYFDGYQAETYFVDGQQLTPSSFGETDTTTGVWKPKAYTGTYGTNGFYLKFSDIATTSGSNAGLGKDFSGNTNYWTTNNISVTAGTTYDAMIDSPTLTSATVANYCTWNPVAGSINTLSNGNLTYSGSTGGDYQRNGTLPVSSGKWYYETVITTFTGADADMYIGFSETSNILNNTKSVGNQANQYSIYNYASATYLNKVTNSSSTATTMTKAVANDVLMFALDLDNNKIWFGKNGTWIDSGNPASGTTPTFSSVTAGSYVPGVTLSGGGFLVTLNSTFGQRPFTYTPPTGFKAWNTFNLPDSTIKKGNTVMDATLYTGTGATATITNAAGFRPDLVWNKGRSSAVDHCLTDSNRGANKQLVSNTTGAELTNTNQVTGFNSNGFSLGADNLGYSNFSGITYVGWQWQAGQGTNTTNTAGSITSTISVSTTAGFSVVTYTGNGATGATVGHGLGVAPKMVIVKQRSGAEAWVVGHQNLTGWNYILNLNSTAAQFIPSTQCLGTPTSTNIVVGPNSATNANTGTYVAYCWAEIAGYSKFGSYTGNGSADGTFVYTGFRPEFVMVKRTDIAGDGWTILDTSRSPSNVSKPKIEANSNVAENISYNVMDILSNGFKLRDADRSWNGSGGTYIYMAFAENPFKNALAR